MSKSRSLLDLVDLLMVSGGLSPQESLRLAREIDVAFGLSTISRGSTEAQRARWRRKAERKRARKRGESPGGPTRSAIVEEIPYETVEGSKEVRKSDFASKTSPQGDKPKRAKRSVGDVLPDDWKPTEDHYVLGNELGMTREYVDDLAKRMGDWALANAHRAVARKAGVRGWNAAFSNWLKSHHERNGGSKHATNRNGGSGNGHTLAAKLRRSVEGTPAGGEPPDGRGDTKPRLQLVDGSREGSPASQAPHRR